MLVLATLGLAGFGILQSLSVGEPERRAGTIVEVPSSQSIHVRIELEDGNRIMIQREHHESLAVGDAVVVTERTNAMGRPTFRISEAVEH